ncbi:MAG: hypothetical protein JWN98_1500 [Abditibacteriota bacterium]|nr:hypothetical protein [Abditibacteriota bacterium]
MFAQMMGSLWLKPGQSQSFEASIGDEMGQLKPGRYRLEAHLSNAPRRIAAPPTTFEITDMALSMAVRTDKSAYKLGEPVQIDVDVTNMAANANRVKIASGLACDLLIRNEAGNPVWNYGANLRFIRALGDVTWQKGETKTYSGTWNGVALPFENTATGLQPGHYQVLGVLQSSPPLFTSPLHIEITG